MTTLYKEADSKIEAAKRGLLKPISALLILSFTFQQISFAAGDLKPLLWDLKSDSKSWAKKVLPDIPPSVAMIEDAWKADGQKDQRIVYLLQDAHTNESGQINLAKILDLLLQKEKSLKYVFSEAAQGDSSLSFLKSKASLSTRKEVSKNYLKKGLLHGPEYLQLTSNQSFTLWGVENPSLYLKALEDYRAVAKDRSKFQDYLGRIESTISTLKPRVLNPSLLLFDESYQKYHSEETPLTDYFSILLRESKSLSIDLLSYPDLESLKNLQTKEEAIDFKLANEEEQKAIASLSQDDQKELLNSQEDNHSPFKLGSTDKKEQKAFYTLLEERLGPSSQKLYPNLFKYFGYLKASQDIQAKSVLKEISSLEEEILTSLTKTQDERLLLQCFRSLSYLKKLFNLTLTPEEYKDYEILSKGLDITRLTGFLNKQIMDLKNHYERSLFLEPGFQDITKHATDFYELTTQRDEAFLNNMLAKLGQDPQPSVLITGGFHTQNLKSLLKQKNISFISLTPQVLHETNIPRYEKLLLNQDLSSFRPLQAQPAALMTLLIHETPQIAQDLSQDLAAARLAGGETGEQARQGLPAGVEQKLYSSVGGRYYTVSILGEPQTREFRVFSENDVLGVMLAVLTPRWRKRVTHP